MAYLKASSTFDSEQVAVASLDIPIEAEHATGDLIIISITQDGGGTEITTAASGWTLIGTQSGVQGQRTVNFWKIASSSSEATVTFSGSNALWAGTVTTWGSPHPTTPINVSSVTNMTGSSNTATSTSVTTTVNNCTLFFVCGYDNKNLQTVNPGDMVNIAKIYGISGISSSQFTGYRNQETAGASGTVSFLVSAANEAGQVWTIAIADADASSPSMGPDTRTVMTPLLRCGDFGIQHDVRSLTAPNTLTATTINTYSLSSTAGVLSLGIILASSPYGSFSRVRSIENTGTSTIYTGFVQNITSTDMSSGFLTFEFALATSSLRPASLSFLIVLEDSLGNWKAWEISNSRGIVTNIAYQAILDLENATVIDSGGTLDLTDIEKIGFLDPRLSATTTIQEFFIKNLFLAKRVILEGGSAESPVGVSFLKKAIDGWTDGFIVGLQGSGQVLSRFPYQIGGGVGKTYSSTFAQSSELPLPFNAKDTRRFWNVGNNSIVNVLKSTTGDIQNLTSTIFSTTTRQKFIVDPASISTGWDFAGSSFIGYDIESKASGVIFNSCTFASCYQLVLEGSGLDSVLVDKSLSSTAVITDSPDLISDSEFVSAGTGHAIEITDIGTFNFLRNTFTGYGANGTSNASIYNNSGGEVTLVLAEGDSIPTILNGAGATTIIDAFVESVGIAFTGLVAGSQVVIYDSGTTDEYFRTNSSSTTAGYDEVTTSLTIDYTIMKAGYVPIRVTGLELTSVQTTPVQQVEDRAYVASTGLTFNTNAFANTGTTRFDLTTASTVQNFYSFMIEAWIAQSSLNNVQFPIEPNGPNSFTFSGGWEWADQDAIDFLSRDGMRYRSGGTVTAIWLSILSIGEATGFTGRYQQELGEASTDTANTGPFDQLIQVYGDATHGNFNFDDYLVLKYQVNGYYQAITDVPAIYGTLADESYVVALEPQEIPDFVTGNPSITGVTITNHGASPVSWDAGNGAKNYSITITDSSTNSAEDIMRWINYNLSLGGTFQSDEAFNWPDMVITDGTNYETARGTVIGSAGATLKGIRVIRTGDVPHPGFVRFQADDGTYGLAPQTQSVTVTNGVAGTRVQVYDLTSSTELFNGTPTFPYTWNDSSPYVADREIRVRAMWQDETDAKIFIDTVIGTSTDTNPALAVRLNQEDDTVYISNNIDGSLVTGITIDDSALLIEFDTGSISWPQIYAYETYWLFTEEGIRDEARIIDAKDTANYAFNGFEIKNITDPEVPLTITGGWGYDETTGTTIALFDTSGGPIFAAPDRVVAFATGSGLSPEQAAQLTAIADDTPLIKSNTDLIPAVL